MGIEVQSEKDHVDEIEEALALASRAMQRGSYGAGVSALEKVTQYCSTRSKLGGKVFLELAMAYEAEGKTDQALGLYAALTKSPMENIKQNADKLLYGLEAMNFMRNEAMLQDFSRKKAADTFIETTGFNDITKVSVLFFVSPHSGRSI
jgi:thioredoxin-like negative regulator of GroEL